MANGEATEQEVTAVALSEREQQLLAEMEQALYAEDPGFASQMRQGRGPGDRRRLFAGIIGVALGLALVVVGINTTFWFGALGFALIVASVAVALVPAPKKIGVVQDDGTTKPAGRRTPRGKRKGKASRPASGSFMDRFEQRWDDRRRERP